ncbi:hypothetical protein GCM10009867_04860 [Pedococcus aerophilus]|uniref:Uncharacterized protein n=1 Tax=Pedococcus aerophilus TaxID=436356 RepID=A0ABN3UEN4_9MICO
MGLADPGKHLEPIAASAFGDAFLQGLDAVWFLDMMEGNVSPEWPNAQVLQTALNTPEGHQLDPAAGRAGRGTATKKVADPFVRFERPGPTQLWGVDIISGVQLVDAGSGEVREAKVVTGVYDHSRVVMAAVVEQAIARAA